MSVPDKIIRCGHCDGYAKLVDSAVIYHGVSYGLMFLCEPCNAYVGVHKGTTAPLGTPADYPTREARKRAHAAFDLIWKYDSTPRRAAYLWLAENLGLPADQTHIGLFDATTADRVVALIESQGVDNIREHIFAAVSSTKGKDRHADV